MGAAVTGGLDNGTNVDECFRPRGAARQLRFCLEVDTGELGIRIWTPCCQEPPTVQYLQVCKAQRPAQIAGKPTGSCLYRAAKTWPSSQLALILSPVGQEIERLMARVAHLPFWEYE